MLDRVGWCARLLAKLVGLVLLIAFYVWAGNYLFGGCVHRAVNVGNKTIDWLDRVSQ